MSAFVYVLRCNDDTYYTGHTSDLAERLRRHSDGRGAAYTANRLPVTLVHSEELPSLESAAARERQLKRWTRAKKEALIAGDHEALHRLARRRH